MTIDHTQISVWVLLACVALIVAETCLIIIGSAFLTRAYRRRQKRLFAEYLVELTVEALHALRLPLDAASFEDARTQIDESLARLKGDDNP